MNLKIFPFKKTSLVYPDMKNAFIFVLFMFMFGLLFGYIFKTTLTGPYDFGNVTWRQGVSMEIITTALNNRLQHAIPDFILIFFSNIEVCLIIALSGLFFAIVPVLCAVNFGSLVGCELRTTLFPALFIHGLFEMIGLLLSCALGVYLFLFIFRKITSTIKGQAYSTSSKEIFYYTIQCFAYISIIIVFAALVESLVSSFLAEVLFCQI